jgi:uncharacterized membrane protein
METMDHPATADLMAAVREKLILKSSFLVGRAIGLVVTLREWGMYQLIPSYMQAVADLSPEVVALMAVAVIVPVVIIAHCSQAIFQGINKPKETDVSADVRKC